MRPVVLRLTVGFVLAWGFIACSESSVTPPLAPSLLNPEKVGTLTIACPADAQAQTLDGKSATVSYSLPTTQGGDPPVIVKCTPESGSSFNVGRNVVDCTASDNIGQTASCAFDAVVLSPPMLSVTKILAFGDSLTAGMVSLPNARALRLALELHNSYPTKLQSRLSEAYRVQSVTTINEGLSGELATEAGSRLQTALSMHSPDLVLLMEGTNDLGTGPASVSATINGIETLLTLIESAGSDVILATIPPIRPYGLGENAELVEPFNVNLRSLAISRRVSLLDIHSVIKNGNCPSTADVPIPCIGQDNLHPTARGYELIADAFFDRIVELYDSPVAVPTVGNVAHSLFGSLR